MPTFSLITDANGNIIGSHFYGDDNAQIEAHEVLCTEAQAQNPSLYQVVNGVVIESPSGARTAQLATLNADYQALIAAPVSFTTAAGTTASFPCDIATITNLNNAIAGAQKTQTWPLNLWMNTAGTPVTPFTFADLLGLASAIEARDIPDYQTLLAQISAVMAATTVQEVQAVTW